MFQIFAIAFKAKTIKLFVEEDEPSTATATTTEEFILLDSAEEEFIPDQKIVVIKPNQTKPNLPDPRPLTSKLFISLN